MAKKYKISKGNLKEFFSFFGVKKTPEKIQNIIDNDPVLQKLQADFKKMNNKYAGDVQKMKIEKPDRFKWYQSLGLIPKDY
jgi:hypothetical protein